MKLIIAGMSGIGSFLVKLLSDKSDYDITVIDSSKEEIESVTDRFNVNGVCGSGSSRTTLLKAGADTADIVIALTPMDEINIMCCMIAKDCGTRYSAALLHCPDIAGDSEYLRRLASIDYVINPRLAAAEEIEMQIGLPGRLKTDAVFDGSAVMLQAPVDKGGALDGRSLAEVKQYFGVKMLIGTVRRERKITIPDGRFVLEAGDDIEIVAEKKSVPEIIKKLGMPRISADRIMIIGCGTTGYYLTERLSKKKSSVRIIDKDIDRCRALSELFPNVEVSYIGDSDTLMEQGIKNVDVFISLTGEDDRNLVNSLFAWSCGVNSIITRINSPQYEKLLDKTDMQITVSPSVTAVERILGFIRNIAFNNEKGDDIGQLRLIADCGAEAIEFMAYDNCRMLDIPFASKDFRLRKGVIIAIIVRGGETIIPDGTCAIKNGDRVIVVTKTGGRYNTLNDIFR